MFSPMVAIASAMAVSTVTLPTFAALILSRSAPTSSATCAIILTSPWNCSLRATKSVSELTSTTTPLMPAAQAPRRDTAGFFRGFRQALFAQPIDRRLHVAFVLGERLLAVHHADAGRFAQVLDHRRCDRCHRCVSFACQGDRGAALAASPPSTTSNEVNWKLVAGRFRPARSNYSASAVIALAWATQPSARDGSPTSSPILWAVS